MLKALGFGKKSLPIVKDEIIKQHKEQSALLKQWEADVKTLQGITHKLQEHYGTHKGDFALGRYEELKNMIKSAVKEFQTYMQEVKSRPRNYAVPPGDGDSKDSRGGGRKLGAISRLRMHAQGFADHSDQTEKQERSYSEMTGKELDAELNQMRKSILQLKQEFYAERDKLELLAKEYEASKRYNPVERYTILKNLIKNACRPPDASS